MLWIATNSYAKELSAVCLGIPWGLTHPLAAFVAYCGQASPFLDILDIYIK